MTTLLEFAKRTRVEYGKIVEDGIDDGLCSATRWASCALYEPEDGNGEGLEQVMDRLIRDNAPDFGGKLTGYYWPVDDTASRFAVLDHIIKELEHESNQG